MLCISRPVYRLEFEFSVSSGKEEQETGVVSRLSPVSRASVGAEVASLPTPPPSRREQLNPTEIHVDEGNHFLQGNSYEEIAERVSPTSQYEHRH